jgi:beta-aspartyl-peptidase (threonine type)
MQQQQQEQQKQMDEIQSECILVIHGGAGTIRKSQMTKEKEIKFREALGRSLTVGIRLLKMGASAIDAVEAAVREMEDDPLFNAGRGSVFTNERTNEMDASIMDGSSLKAGAVAGVTTIKNPIVAARKVMEESPHIMLMGKGAERFAKEKGLELVDSSYFFTEWRYEQLLRTMAMEQGTDWIQTSLDHSVLESNKSTPGNISSNDLHNSANKIGTVGAVAIDIYGNLAAATSTGGMTNKRYNRCGDSPIIGCGTFANRHVAISCTGHGEEIIRHVVAHEIAAMLKYKSGITLSEACEAVVFNMPNDTCGVIAIDHKGNIAMPFNTEGMYCGWVKSDESVHVQIYKE